MFLGLLVVLLLTFILPLTIKAVEHNIEFFLFIMGISAIIISGNFSIALVHHILSNHFLYYITAAVLIISFLFKTLKFKMEVFIHNIIRRIPLKLFIFLMVFILGLLSSMITAMVGALILVEIIMLLPLDKQSKINLNIISCFAIGLGAVLTPIGEPVATIVTSKLNADFFYLFRELGIYVVISIFLLSLLAAFVVNDGNKQYKGLLFRRKSLDAQGADPSEIEEVIHDTNKDILYRSFKIFIFVIALELLGGGFKPIIDNYIINLNSSFLYWGNTLSAVLDNATLAAAEISPKMNNLQIRAIMLGLLVSGGMLIPGNIPNIISAGKLKIKSSEWIRVGVPLGLIMLIGFYVILFIM